MVILKPNSSATPLTSAIIQVVRPARPNGASAPFAIDRLVIRDNEIGVDLCAPSPWHSGHAPYGLLNEKLLGAISSMLMPRSGTREILGEEQLLVARFVILSTAKDLLVGTLRFTQSDSVAHHVNCQRAGALA